MPRRLHPVIFALCMLPPAACKQSSAFSGSNGVQANAAKRPAAPVASMPAPSTVPPRTPTPKYGAAPVTTRPFSVAYTPDLSAQTVTAGAPSAAVVPACVNRFRNENVADPRTGLRFRILPETLGFCDGAAACDKVFGGQLPWLKMVVPDQLLDCQEQAGWWIQNFKGEWLDRCDGAALRLFEVNGEEESDLGKRAPILCVF